jgi:small GTP-binding protein
MKPTTAHQSLFQTRTSYGLASSVDGSRIVGACHNEGIAVWSGEEGASPTIHEEKVSDASHISLSADGGFAFVGTLDGVVAKWDLGRGKRVAFFEGHSKQAYAVAVTPDGRLCVSGSGDNTIRLWAVESGQCLAILRGHTNLVTGVAITPDGRRIASVDWEGKTLRVWDIPEAILGRTATSRKRGYKNATVVLLGDSGVGKSGLALRLWRDHWEPTESTHGMEIQRLSDLPKADQEESGVEHEVWLWDLAGQPDYRLTHQLFMNETSLALLVFDPQNPNLYDTVSYWQSALQKVAKAEHVEGILVAARCDRPGLRLSLDEVKEWARKRKLHGPIITKAKLKTKTKNGTQELRAAIADLLPWDGIEFRSTPPNFPPLKDAILALRGDEKATGGVVVTPPQLLARVKKAAPDLEFTPQDLVAVTTLLAGEGVLFKLPYGDLIVLQPSWINCYASTLVKLAGDALVGHVPLSSIEPGKLPNDDEVLRLKKEDERELLPALVALFLENKVAWKQDTDRGTMLVFPNYVRLPREERPPRPGQTVLYRFTGPLEEIYCTLVVRLRYSGLFPGEPKLWRDAADFRTDTEKLAALTLNAKGEHGELDVYFGEGMSDELQASFQRFVDNHLKTKAATLERLRNFCCPKCGYEARDRDVMDELLTDGVTEMPCQRCFLTKQGVINLNDVLERQLADQEGAAQAEMAGRKADERIDTAWKEGAMEGAVRQIVFEANQIYRRVEHPDYGIDGELAFKVKGTEQALNYRVQLKAGKSHLRKLKSGEEKFDLKKKHYEDLWCKEGATPVLLIIQTDDGRIRYVNATETILAERRANPGKKRVTMFDFDGEEFDRKAVLHLRDERLNNQ